jgi:hypothetical protein
MTEGIKHDESKSRLDLVPPLALEAVGHVLGYGATKYDAHNWMKGMAWGRMLGAGLRHTFAFIRGQNRDPESGLPHLAHAACCLLMALEYYIRGIGKDDRFHG